MGFVTSTFYYYYYQAVMTMLVLQNRFGDRQISVVFVNMLVPIFLRMKTACPLRCPKGGCIARYNRCKSLALNGNDAAFRDRGLTVHHWLLRKRGVDGVISDESEGNKILGYKKHSSHLIKHPPIIVLIFHCTLL